MTFFFEFASTYSYPAAMRIESQASARGVGVDFRPFLLGPIFRAQGWNDSPFNLYPARGRYMWRDLARVCDAQGLALRRPSVFPRNGLLAARAACAAAFDDDGRLRATPAPWLPAFVRAVYRANFEDDLDIASADVVRACLARALGETSAARDRIAPGESLERPLAHRVSSADTPDANLARASLPGVKEALRAQTERAVALGIFGAPSFVVGDELFWGNDRLDAALDFARQMQNP